MEDDKACLIVVKKKQLIIVYSWLVTSVTRKNDDKHQVHALRQATSSLLWSDSCHIFSRKHWQKPALTQTWKRGWKLMACWNIFDSCLNEARRNSMKKRKRSPLCDRTTAFIMRISGDKLALKIFHSSNKLTKLKVTNCRRCKKKQKTKQKQDFF